MHFKYMFVFGRDSELSFLEIISYFQARNINHKLEFYMDNIAIFSLSEMDFSNAIDELGGTVKIGKVINSLDELKISRDKIRLGISVYKGDKSKLEKELKIYSKEQKIKIIYKKPKRAKYFMPSELLKLNLLELLFYNEKLAVTIAVSNPSKYEERDKKPFFD